MATYLLGGGDGEGKAVYAGSGGHEGLGLLGVDLGEEPDDDSLALRLEGLSLLHGGDSLTEPASNKKRRDEKLKTVSYQGSKEKKTLLVVKTKRKKEVA